MGATLRQATVLGLHREYADKSNVDGSTAAEATSADVRRRTWWSLFVLDTWAKWVWSSAIKAENMLTYYEAQLQDVHRWGN